MEAKRIASMMARGTGLAIILFLMALAPWAPSEGEWRPALLWMLGGIGLVVWGNGLRAP